MSRLLRAVATVLVLALAPAALAQSPQLHGIVLSDAKDGMGRASFSTTTKTIHLRALLKDVPVGAILRGDWIAAKSQIAPPNTKFNSAFLTVAPGMVRADFTLDRPPSGFPAGEYRVELFINNRKVHTVQYKVQ